VQRPKWRPSDSLSILAFPLITDLLARIVQCNQRLTPLAAAWYDHKVLHFAIMNR
jgi:hypothetical protein